MLPTTGDVRPVDNAAITRMFGDPHWHAIWKAKLDDEITPPEAWTEYVDLMRWRLETILGYRWTHQLEIRNTRGNPLYHLIFATDSQAGHDIISHLYDQAASEFPAMAQEARRIRERIRQEEHGVFDLFSSVDMDPPPPTAVGARERLYFHAPPEEPREHDGAICPYCA